MATSYTTALRLALPNTGELVNTWGTVVNQNITQMLEQAITGIASVVFGSDADYTAITYSNGTTDQMRCAVLNVTSTATLTATRNLVLPVAAGVPSKLYVVTNGTTGGQAIVLKGPSSTNTVTIPNGYTLTCYYDGTNVWPQVTATSGTFNVTGNVLATAVAQRFQADLSNATLGNRLYFQDKTTNSAGAVSVMANGTPASGTSTAFVAFNASDPANSSFAQIGVQAAATANPVAFISASRTGTGGILPLAVQLNYGEAFRLVQNAGNAGTIFQADFSNATLSNRFSFQDKTANNVTAIQVLPNGSAAISGISVFNNSSPTNAAYGQVLAGTGSIQVGASVTGSGTALPLDLLFGPGSIGMRIFTDGRVAFGTTTNDGQHGLQLTGSGGMSVTSLSQIGQYEMPAGASTTWYNAGFRNDGSDIYLMGSAAQTTLALAQAASWNSNRPFRYTLSTGAVFIDTGSTGGGVVVGNQRTGSLFQVKSGAWTPTITVAAAATTTLDATTSNAFYITMGTNISSGITISNVQDGQSIVIMLRQDATGSRTAVLSNFAWEGGAVPTLTTAANAMDVITTTYSGTYAKFISSIMKDVK